MINLPLFFLIFAVSFGMIALALLIYLHRLTKLKTIYYFVFFLIAINLDYLLVLVSANMGIDTYVAIQNTTLFKIAVLLTSYLSIMGIVYFSILCAHAYLGTPFVKTKQALVFFSSFLIMGIDFSLHAGLIQQNAVLVKGNNLLALFALFGFLMHATWLCYSKKRFLTPENRTLHTYILFMSIACITLLVVNNIVRIFYPAYLNAVYLVIALRFFFINTITIYLIIKFGFVRLHLFRNRESPDRLRQFFDQRGITSREREVILLLVEGKRYKEIADQLFISAETVKKHASSIYRKTEVSGKLKLRHLMVQSGLSIDDTPNIPQ